MNPGKDAWIGVMGGGQLGRMLSLASRKMGVNVLAWTGGDRSGAASTADRIIDKAFDDPSALEDFTQSVGAATVEFENLPVETLKQVEEKSLSAREVRQFRFVSIANGKKVSFRKWFCMCKL